MRTRNTSAIALHLLLVLMSLLAVTDHDHLGERNQEPQLCVSDHDAGHDRLQPSSVPRLDHGTKQHEHECLGCRLGNQRPSLDPPQENWGPLSTAQGLRVPGTSRRALFLPSIRTSRGPPTN